MVEPPFPAEAEAPCLPHNTDGAQHVAPRSAHDEEHRWHYAPIRHSAEKTLRSTVALTAARGRGKSAALGLAIAGALALG